MQRETIESNFILEKLILIAEYNASLTIRLFLSICLSLFSQRDFYHITQKIGIRVRNITSVGKNELCLHLYSIPIVAVLVVQSVIFCQTKKFLFLKIWNWCDIAINEQLVIIHKTARLF